METIKTIQQDCENLIVIEKSKFFAFSYYIESDERVKEILSALSQKYYDATHICYGYKVNSKQKCSDNGEPQGTAGKPILDCIQKKKLENVLVVVVRYFGGIKLGAGGLTRAYSNSASAVLDKSKSREITMCSSIKFEILPNEVKKTELIKQIECVKDVEITFDEKIIVVVICNKSNREQVIQNINNIYRRNIEIISCESIYYKW